MYTMEDFVSDKIAVRTGTGEKQQKFLKLCEKNGLKWASGRRAAENRPDVFGEDCCIAYTKGGTRGIVYSLKEYYEKNEYKICEPEEIEGMDCKCHEISITVDGDITTARLIVSGRTVKEATARRNPEDRFSLAKGAKLALDRLFARATDAKTGEEKLRVGDRVVCTSQTEGNKKNRRQARARC